MEQTKLTNNTINDLKRSIAKWNNDGVWLIKILFDMEEKDWGSVCNTNITDIKRITDHLKLRLYEIENSDFEEYGCD